MWPRALWSRQRSSCWQLFQSPKRNSTFCKFQFCRSRTATNFASPVAGSAIADAVKKNPPPRASAVTLTGIFISNPPVRCLPMAPSYGLINRLFVDLLPHRGFHRYFSNLLAGQGPPEPAGSPISRYQYLNASEWRSGQLRCITRPQLHALIQRPDHSKGSGHGSAAAAKQIMPRSARAQTRQDANHDLADVMGAAQSGSRSPGSRSIGDKAFKKNTMRRLLDRRDTNVLKFYNPESNRVQTLMNLRTPRGKIRCTGVSVCCFVHSHLRMFSATPRDIGNAQRASGSRVAGGPLAAPVRQKTPTARGPSSANNSKHGVIL